MENANGKGAIFKNDKKGNDKAPDYRGTLTTPKGEEVELALWLKTSEKGTQYLSVSAKEPFKKDNQTQQSNKNKSDDLPF